MCGGGGDPTVFQTTWSLDDQAVHEEARQLEELRSRAAVDSWHRRASMELRRLWEFVVLPLNIVDLLAIVPFYIELASAEAGGGLGLTVFRVLRLGRVFRIFKLGKSSATLQLMAKVMLASADALSIMVFFIAIGVVLFGALLWIAEGGEYDAESGTFLRLDEFGTGRERTPFESIPATAWFIIVTLTTLGYGDQVPNTTLGRTIAALLALVGILVLALPVTILGANFAYFYSQDEKEKEDAERERFRAEEGFEDDLSDVYSQAGALDEIDAGPLGQAEQYDLERDDPVLAAAAIGLHDDVPRWAQRKAAFFPVQPGGYVPALRSFVYNPFVKDDTFADGIAEALAAEVDERIGDLRGDAVTRRRRVLERTRMQRAAAEIAAAAAAEERGRQSAGGGSRGSGASVTAAAAAAALAREEEEGEEAVVRASDSRVVRRRSAAAVARKRRRRSSATGAVPMTGLRTLGGLGQKGPSVVTGEQGGASGAGHGRGQTTDRRRRGSATSDKDGPGGFGPKDGSSPDAGELIRAARKARRKSGAGSMPGGMAVLSPAPGFHATATAVMAASRWGRRLSAVDATEAAPQGAHHGAISAPVMSSPEALQAAPGWVPAEEAMAGRRRSHSRAITAVAASRDRPRGAGPAADAGSDGAVGKRDLYAKLTETRQRRDEWKKRGRFNRGAGGPGGDASDDNASEDGGLAGVLGLSGPRGGGSGSTPLAGGGGGAGMGVSWQIRQVVKQVSRAVRADGTAEAVTAVRHEQAEMRETLERTQEGLRTALEEIRGLASAMKASKRRGAPPPPASDGGMSRSTSRSRPRAPPRSSATPDAASVDDMADRLRRQMSPSELKRLLRRLEDATEP